MAFQSFFAQMETAFSSFLDQVIDKKDEWKTKEDLMDLFLSQSGAVATGAPVYKVSKSNAAATAAVASTGATGVAVASGATGTSDKCIFIITRGDKMGEKCSSRVKPGAQHCVKHYKPTKEDEKKEVVQKDIVQKEDKKKKCDEPEEKRTIVSEESKTISLEMKFKKQEEIPTKTAEFVSQGKYRIVKNTKVVVNDKNDIIGYLNKSVLVHGSNKEVDAVSREYKLNINKNDWSSNHIDE